ncbi:MAG TPA: hypothetical protein PKK00_09035 [Bacteroidales bacterium]|nr:hypothetical protein [Bacteroidales bacterium]HPS17355.1 hypothetical protein [Bacteroidales bacterium]
MKKEYFLLLLILLSFQLFSQKNANFIKAEDSLQKLGTIIIGGENDFIKYNANEKFLSLLGNTLLQENSFDYPFDSLITIARLVSEDKKLRIFNWNLRKTDGTYEYFGIIQAWNKKEKKYYLYPLKDNSDKITTPEMQNLTNTNWYGAHYYKIIYNKSRGKKYYTLLGWDGNDLLSQKKIIDVLIFNSNEKPVFGASIFKYNKKLQKRVIFEYSTTVSMSLKYEKQFMYSGKKNRKSIVTDGLNIDIVDKVPGKKSRNMIVFDRLAPKDPSLEGQYQFYYPETNVFDAFIFRMGKWNMVKDVDARMRKKTGAEKAKVKAIIKEQKKHQRN